MAPVLKRAGAISLTYEVNVQIVIRNVVRDPRTRALRRANIGNIQVSPVIGGQALPPRRSRKVDTAQLTGADLHTITKMVDCGVLRVFHERPFVEASSDELRELTAWKRYRELTEPVVAPVPEAIAPAPAPAPAPPPEPLLEVPEEPPNMVRDADQIQETSEDLVNEPVPEPVVALKHTASELQKLKNAELREILSSLSDGDPGAGMKKAELVDSILKVSA